MLLGRPERGWPRIWVGSRRVGVAQETVAACHEACLGQLVGHVAVALDGFPAGDLDVFEVDRVVFRYSRPAKGLWKFCKITDVEFAASLIDELRPRRLSLVGGFHRTCVIDSLLEHSPAEHVRRPHVGNDSPTLGLSRLQFEALLSAARDSENDNDFALVAVLGLLGLRIFEATGADITDLSELHGH